MALTHANQDQLQETDTAGKAIEFQLKMIQSHPQELVTVPVCGLIALDNQFMEVDLYHR